LALLRQYIAQMIHNFLLSSS